jgi:hypothetical protein
MISTSKLVRLIATIGFSRAVFVCGLCLLVVHVVTFEEFVILALFGFVMDGVSVRRLASKKHKTTKGTAWDESQAFGRVPANRSKQNGLTNVVE